MDYSDFVNKCRCCFELQSESEELLVITSPIEEMFLELCQVELKSFSDTAPSFICQKCFSDLQFSTEFRRNSIANQQNFQKFLESEQIAEILEDQTTFKTSTDSSDIHKTQQPDDPLEDFMIVKIEKIDVKCEEVEDVECSQCFQVFPASSIKQHIQDTHVTSLPSKRYFCNLCDYSAAKSNRLENHCQKVHQSSAPKVERKRHRETELKTRKQCPECGILVKNISEHQKIIHHQLKRFLCDFCNYSCYFKTKITRHLQRHIPKHLREQFPCDFPDCPFIATRKDALKSHVLTMHQETREKNCLCIECGKSFYNKSQLNIHIKSVHEKVRNHLCNLCGKPFFNSKDLEMHVKRHGVKDTACEVCGNLFYCSLDLKRHLKIHSDPTIVCEVENCNKRFYTKSKLKMHVKVRHEGAKDYFCDYCSSRFSQYNNLKRHVNSVHKSLRINCVIPDCNFSVARKDKYKNHLASQHKFLDEKSKESILKSVKFE